MDGRGCPWRDHRQVFNGVLWRLRTGAPRRDLPERYGNPGRPSTSGSPAGKRTGPGRICWNTSKSATLRAGWSGPSPSTPRSTGPTSTRPAPAKGGPRTATDRVARRGRGSHRPLVAEPARRHPDPGPGPSGQGPPVCRARLPRTPARTGPVPLRRPFLAGSAAARQPRDRRPPLPRRTTAGPGNPRTGRTLHQVLDALLDALSWNDVRTTRRQALPTRNVERGRQGSSATCGGHHSPPRGQV